MLPWDLAQLKSRHYSTYKISVPDLSPRAANDSLEPED
jgi:hypothetical protein